MKRKIIRIDEEKCTGCGLCIPGCPEGALQIIDGKARLVSDLFCDGLGACIGTCPENAITIEEREAEEYDETRTMENIIRQGPNVIAAHLEHLREHGDTVHLREALRVLEEKGLPNPLKEPANVAGHPPAGCPGARSMQFNQDQSRNGSDYSPGEQSSELAHWPVQLHLISPAAQQYRGADLLLAADCTAFALGNFHRDYLKGKALAIACPKLDRDQEIYIEKIKALVDQAKINTLTVMIMEVPCCGGLLAMAEQALAAAGRKVPLKRIIVGLDGEIRQEEWV